jgi:hypothetical protein
MRLGVYALLPQLGFSLALFFMPTLRTLGGAGHAALIFGVLERTVASGTWIAYVCCSSGNPSYAKRLAHLVRGMRHIGFLRLSFIVRLFMCLSSNDI